MGLMLSVFVFCVGVAEMWDCWDHFFLYLVQPQHNPLPFHLDPKSDILSERELTTHCEGGKQSRVDICWPKDLSPTDDLHVIKKRSHSESERKHDQDKDSSGHHSTRNLVSCSDQSQISIVKSCPKIEIHCIEDDGDDISPLTSRENSPGLLELDVIVESDSSSEFDEPSQIENLAYVMKLNGSLNSSVGSNDSVDISDKQSSLCESDAKTLSNISSTIEPEGCFSRPTSPIETSERETQIVNVEKPNDDNALLKDFPKCSESGSIDDSKTTPYYGGENQRSLNSKQLDQASKSVSEEIEPSESSALYSFSETQSEPFQRNKDDSAKVQIDSCDVDDLFTITEIPEVTLRESSPVLLDDSTDSSLNTSDASWMVKSRTSDRPLVIRFNQENAASDFMSVTKTDLQAFDGKRNVGEVSNRDGKDSDIVISDSQEQSKSLSGGKGTGSRERPLQTPQGDDDSLDPNGVEGANDIKRNNYGEDNKTSTQHETNSSSSSLSGIPQLPEDVRDNNPNTSLPSDNGYGKGSSQTDRDYQKTSDSGSDYLVQPTSESFVLEVACELEQKQSSDSSKSKVSDTNNVLHNTDPSVDYQNHGIVESSDVVQTGSLVHVGVQPLAVAVEEKILEDDLSESSLKNLSSSPVLVNFSKELPGVNTKPNISLQTYECPISISIAKSTEPYSSMPDDAKTTQPPGNSDHPDQDTRHHPVDNILDTESSDADFKPKPLQRRDTKRKSKITPRTFSRENSSKSDEIEVSCNSNEPSEADSLKNEVPSVALRTSPSQSEKEVPVKPPSLDKAEPSSQPSAGGSHVLPTKTNDEVNFYII